MKIGIFIVQKTKQDMKKFLLTLLALILVLSAASAQNSLIIKYEGNGVYGGGGMLSSEAYKAKDEIVSKLQKNFLAILVESGPNRFGTYIPITVWIYLNDPENPTDYNDVSDIKSDYLDTIDLFCIKLSPKLRRILKHKGVKPFLESIGVKYNIDENGDVVTHINYDKLEKFV